MPKRKRTFNYNPDKESTEPLYRQIYSQVRDAIIQRKLTAGDRLPSIRRSAEETAVSHTTIEQAYQQLALEGYVRNIPRSGYVVEKLDTDFLKNIRNCVKDSENKAAEIAAGRDQDAFFAENIHGSHARYDFSYANLQPDSFPVDTWRKLMSDVLYAGSAKMLTRYRNVDEPTNLNVQLVRYLAQTRDISCSPHQVLVQAGTDGALTTALYLFDREKHTLGIEEPGYPTALEVARRMGFSVTAIPSDLGTDALISALYKRRPKIVFTTPSHQFPTGSVLRLDARIRLLKWARETNAFIIEDDSCNEFRYQTKPIPSLYSLDQEGRTIYLCNVSKVLSPSMRLSYMVLPLRLLRRYFATFNNTHPPYPLLEQEVLARFIEGGYWESHLRRSLTGNRKRHDELCAQIAAQMPGMVEVEGVDAGIHLYATVNNGMTQAELVENAFAQGAAVYGTKRFWFERQAPENKIMLGFSSIALEDIAPGIAALRRAWFG